LIVSPLPTLTASYIGTGSSLTVAFMSVPVTAITASSSNRASKYPPAISIPASPGSLPTHTLPSPSATGSKAPEEAMPLSR
jgi:hypothetical protein